MIELRVLPGDDIEEVSCRALSAAYKTTEVVTFDFNGVRFIAFKK